MFSNSRVNDTYPKIVDIRSAHEKAVQVEKTDLLSFQRKAGRAASIVVVETYVVQGGLGHQVFGGL